MPKDGVEKSGRFKPVDGSRFEGCVQEQMSKGLSRESAEKLCAYIGRRAGKIASADTAAATTLDAGYSFSENKDGTYTIHDVPIMAEVPEAEKGNKRRVGKKWMQAAVEKAGKRLSEDGYKAPLHVDHHGKGPTEPAGFVVPKAVQRFTYEGKKVWAVFADLEVQPEVMAKVKAKALPYRSVEIFDWGKPEISSLALLSDEVPYFRFPVLRLGEEKKPVQTFAQRGPAMACRGFALGSAVLFSFHGDTTMNPEQTEVGEASQEAPAMLEDSDDDEIKIEVKDKEDQAAAFDAIMSVLTKMAKKLGVDEDEEEEDEKETEDAEAVESPVEQSSLAAMQGKIEALEQRERARKEEETRETVVGAAMDALSAWSPDDTTRENLITLVANSTSPKKTATAFVSSYKASVPQRPASTYEEFDARLGAGSDHAEVLKFAEKGPDHLTAARAASRQYDELTASGLTSTTRGDFIQTQIDAADGEIVRR